MKFIDEEKIENKKVILRCDFNVPIENGKVLDDTKVVKSLKTINYLLDNNCSLILLSHLGRVKSKKDKSIKKQMLKQLDCFIDKPLTMLTSSSIKTRFLIPFVKMKLNGIVLKLINKM